MTQSIATTAVELLGDAGEDGARILTADALAVVAELERELRAARRAGFRAEMRAVREDPTWRVAPAPRALLDRRVELTGSVDRQSVIDGLSSGAQMFVAGFEDAQWVGGQANLVDAVDGAIALDDGVATLLVRPRGRRDEERRVLVDGEPASAGLLDFALFVFHCGRLLLERGAGPYLYLGGIDSHVEARLWNDVFRLAEQRLAMPRGTIRATVLVESAAAAVELEEILYELREHSAGLNAAREGVASLVVAACHRRGAHAIGGVGPFARQARDGFDGTSVPHPDVVATAMCVFDHVLGERPNQLDRIERS
jgi:malate synthase